MGISRSLFALVAIAAITAPALAQSPRKGAQHFFGAPRAGDLSAVSSCVERAESRDALTACITVVSSPCINAPGGETTAATVECLIRSRGAWDAALNRAYGALMASESPGQKRALRSAQTAWIAWRDAGCAYDASEMEGGSLARVISADCLAQTTAERAIDLIARQRGPEFN